MRLQLMGRATRIYIYSYIIGNIFISIVTIETLSGILESLPGKLLGITCTFIYEEMLISYAFWTMCFSVCIKHFCTKSRLVLSILDFFAITCSNLPVVHGDHSKKKRCVKIVKYIFHIVKLTKKAPRGSIYGLTVVVP